MFILTPVLKRSYYAFWIFVFLLLCYVSFFVHVKGLQSEKDQNPCQKEFLCPASPALPETPGLESAAHPFTCFWF